MKRLMLLLTCLSSVALVHAQPEAVKPIIDRDIVRDLLQISGILTGLFLVITFFLTLLHTWLDARLKSKLVDRGATEGTVAQLLQPLKKESRMEPVKWFTILTGLGIGLLLINFTQPIGLHSLAIMSFSLAAGFLGYYLITKKTGDPDNNSHP